MRPRLEDRRARWWRGPAALLGDRRGLVLTETALLLPVLLAFWIGTYEISRAFQADRRLTLATVTIADLVTRYESFSASDLDDIDRAAELILEPLPTTSFGLRLTGVVIDGTGRAVVVWSMAESSTAYGDGEVLADVTGYEPGSSLVVVDTSFTLAATVPLPIVAARYDFTKRQIAASRPFPSMM